MSGLMEEYRIGEKLVLKNRLVMPPMATGKASKGDNVPEEIISYYEDRARYSRVGLIITEHSFIHQEGKAHGGQMSFSRDEDVESFRPLVDRIHSHGVKVIAQLNHAGSATSAMVTGLPTKGPSAVLHPRKKDGMPVEMTKDDIRAVATWFAAAAKRAKEAGFDGVEIHSAHGYLLNQFYSPLTNRRSDEYGPDTVENRTRIHREVIEEVRKAVGEEYLVAIRLGGSDYAEGGSSISDAVEASRLFQKAGVDLLDISGGLFGYVVPGLDEPGYFKAMTKSIMEKVDIPVVLTGGVTTLPQAESLVDEGWCDLVGVGRAIFKNAHWTD